VHLVHDQRHDFLIALQVSHLHLICLTTSDSPVNQRVVIWTVLTLQAVPTRRALLHLIVLRVVFLLLPPMSVLAVL
jgi:hypothetical protein